MGFRAVLWILLSSCSLVFAGFERLDHFVAVPDSIRLEKAEKLGIPYQSFILKDPHNFEVFQFIQFRFGKLNRVQFDALKAAYAGDRSAVPYDADREYELIDFLLPKMQALIHTRFPSMQRKKDWVSSNCWGTAYDLLRYTRDISVFYVDDSEIRPQFESPDHSTLIAEVERDIRNDAPAILDAQDKLQFGDLALLYFGWGLAHAAIYVDKGIYFEMTGSKPHWPYRLTRNLFDPNLRFNKTIQAVDFYRFNSPGKELLPHPADVFFEHTSKDTRRFSFAEVPLQLIKEGRFEGRYELPADAFDEKKSVRYFRQTFKSHPVSRIWHRVARSCAGLLQ